MEPEGSPPQLRGTLAYTATRYAREVLPALECDFGDEQEFQFPMSDVIDILHNDGTEGWGMGANDPSSRLVPKELWGLWLGRMKAAEKAATQL
jgi:hypothetical protein